MKSNKSMKFGVLAMLLLAALSVSFVACSSDEFYEHDDDLTLANRKTRSGGEVVEGDDTSVTTILGGSSVLSTYPFTDGCEIRPEFAWSPFNRVNKASSDIVYRLFYQPVPVDYCVPAEGDTIRNISRVYVIEASTPKVKWGAIHRDDADINVKFDYYLLYRLDDGITSVRYPYDNDEYLKCDKNFNIRIRTL